MVVSDTRLLQRRRGRGKMTERDVEKNKKNREIAVQVET